MFCCSRIYPDGWVCIVVVRSSFRLGLLALHLHNQYSSYSGNIYLFLGSLLCAFGCYALQLRNTDACFSHRKFQVCGPHFFWSFVAFLTLYRRQYRL